MAFDLGMLFAIYNIKTTLHYKSDNSTQLIKKETEQNGKIKIS